MSFQVLLLVPNVFLVELDGQHHGLVMCTLQMVMEARASSESAEI